MDQKTKLTPDEFKRTPTCGLLELDPKKPYIVMLPQDTPDQFAQKLSTDMSQAGIFAMILTGPNTMRVFSSFPVDIELKMRKMKVCEEALMGPDAEPIKITPHPVKGRKTVAKKSTRKRKTTEPKS